MQNIQGGCKLLDTFHRRYDLSFFSSRKEFKMVQDIEDLIRIRDVIGIITAAMLRNMT